MTTLLEASQSSNASNESQVLRCVIEESFAISLSTGIASILVHCIILRSVFKRCDWLNTRYYIILNLSVGDLFLVFIPFIILPSFSKPYASSTCISLIHVTDALITTGVLISTLSVISLTLHRYIFCLYPFSSQRILSRKNTFISIAIVWFFALGICIGNAFATLSEPLETHPIGLRLFGSTIHLTVVLIGCVIVVFVQGRLLYVTLNKLRREHLQRRVILLQLQVTIANSIRRIHNRNKCRKLLPILIVMITYIALTIPFPVAWLLHTLGEYREHEHILDACMIGLPFLTATLNPLVYGITIYEVRRAIFKDLRDVYRAIYHGRNNAVQPEFSTTSKRTSRIFQLQSDA